MKMGMTNGRWKQLSEDDSLKLTPEEINDGWHFCLEFDGLLIGPDMGELHACRCLPKEHPVYKSCPPEDSKER